MKRPFGLTTPPSHVKVCLFVCPINITISLTTVALIALRTAVLVQPTLIGQKFFAQHVWEMPGSMTQQKIVKVFQFVNQILITTSRITVATYVQLIAPLVMQITVGLQWFVYNATP